MFLEHNGPVSGRKLKCALIAKRGPGWGEPVHPEFLRAKAMQVFFPVDQMYSRFLELAWNCFDFCPRGPGRIMELQLRESI